MVVHESAIAVIYFGIGIDSASLIARIVNLRATPSDAMERLELFDATAASLLRPRIGEFWVRQEILIGQGFQKRL